MYNNIESMKKMQDDTNKLKVKYSDQMNKRITFDKNLKNKLKEGYSDNKKETFTDIYYSPKANKGTLIELTPKDDGTEAQNRKKNQQRPDIRIQSPRRGQAQEEVIILGINKDGTTKKPENIKKRYASGRKE